MAPSDVSQAKRARREGKCNTYLHFAAVAAHSAMGLRIGDDETYKFHPPMPERKRSVRKTLQSRRNNESSDETRRCTKSPASDLKGFITHIKSGVTSTQSTNYNTTQNSSYGSIGSRPPSQSSFTCSTDEESSKKWWSSRSHRGKESNKSGRQTPGFLTRSPSLDVWTGKDLKEPSQHHLQNATPKNISEPYNFQHHMHVQPQQFAQVANASQNDLVAEFSAIRAAQSARRCLDGVDAGQRGSYMALTQSVPSSFQVTARSSMQVPEPFSPRSEQTAHYVGSKGSFSMPFKDGKSPRLDQQPSTEFRKMMPISDATIAEQEPQPEAKLHPVRRRDPRGEGLFSHCHSVILDKEQTPDELSGLEGTPVEGASRPDDVFSTETTEGLKTGFYASPQERKAEHYFKELSPEPRLRAQCQKAKPLRPPRPFAPLIADDEVRVSMNRSSINGGLFSSWATGSDSSEDGDASPEQVHPASVLPQQRIAARMMQRAARNSKSKPAYKAPATPPPISPLPQVPQQQSQPTIVNIIQHAKTDSHHERNDFAAIEEEEENSPLVVSDTSEAPEATSKALPPRRPSIKNVRFKTDDTLINGDDERGPENKTSLDRVQATLDDLHKNLSRLETDLTRGAEEQPKPRRRGSESSKHARQPSHPPRETIGPRPKTSDGKTTLANSGHRRHRTTSGVAGKPPGRVEANSSRMAGTANRPSRAKTISNDLAAPPADLSKLHAPLPPLPPQAKAASKRRDERHYSSGSTTLPASIAV